MHMSHTITFRIPPLKCSEIILPHLDKVFSGEYDVPLFRRENYVIADCGANCGAFAIWAYHRWPGSQIHCYEPHAETFSRLQENLRPYREERFRLYPFGLGTPGKRHLEGNNICGEASVSDDPTATSVPVQVESALAIPYDTNILKIDTEGAEVEILEPLIGAGRKFLAIMIEYHQEDYRRRIDILLSDYRLVSHQLMGVNQGTVCYLHRSLFSS